MAIVLVLLIRVLTVVRRLVSTGRIDTRSTCELFCHKYRKCIKVWGGCGGGGKLKFVSGNPESGESDHAIILPTRVGSQFRPVRERLVGGDAELLLRMNITGELFISDDAGKSNSHVRQCEWAAMTRDGVNLWVFPRAPYARGYKIWGAFRENGKFRISGIGGGSGYH